MEFFLTATLNGLSYGFLLFMLSAGLTLIFSLMGVMNFAHASFYMLGGFVGYSIHLHLGFWVALVVAPIVVGLIGAAFEWCVLRPVHRLGHIAEMLVTFGFAYVALEVVHLIWGRSPVPFTAASMLQGPAFTLTSGVTFPMSRIFIMVTALSMLALMAGVLRYTRTGLIVQAAITHPAMVQALGHNVPRVYMAVFAFGCGLAALAGVVGGSTFITEPAMAASVGPVIFVVAVVGGLGSLSGALLAALLIGLLQSYAVAWEQGYAPLLPYIVMLVTLVLRPRGLLGQREA